MGGDLTRDGSIHRFEFENIKADLDSLPFPYHVIPGNMETGNKHTRVSGNRQSCSDVDLNVTSEQLAQFSSVFGPLWWSFVHKGVRFSGFCDMVVNSGLHEEAALWEWMESLRREPKAAHHVWIMHYALFVDELHEGNFDITDNARYLDWYFGINEPGRSRLMEVFKATGAEIVISGHIHCRRTRHAERIRFDYAPATSFAQWGDRWPDGDPTLGFLKYDVSDEGIECTFVPLQELSMAKGYGPGGHPSP
ncbi:MAG: metallophosphoesterase, partial [Armatimonadetes bacterium]|nr:metallophosphoesterase [Armatimonadota bacterium]